MIWSHSAKVKKKKKSVSGAGSECSSFSSRVPALHSEVLDLIPRTTTKTNTQKPNCLEGHYPTSGHSTPLWPLRSPSLSFNTISTHLLQSFYTCVAWFFTSLGSLLKCHYTKETLIWPPNLNSTYSFHSFLIFPYPALLLFLVAHTVHAVYLSVIVCLPLRYTRQKSFIIIERHGHGGYNGTGEWHKYEDRYLLYLNKALGMMTHACNSFNSGSWGRRSKKEASLRNLARLSEI